VPSETLPEKRLLPNVSVTPEIAVLLKLMSLFDIRTEPLLETPMLLLLTTERSTATCAPGSASTPACELPENVEFLIVTLLPLAGYGIQAPPAPDNAARRPSLTEHSANKALNAAISYNRHARI
jgi:hypothetical protein